MRQNYISNYQNPSSSKIFQRGQDEDFKTDMYIGNKNILLSPKFVLREFRKVRET